jgi:hypothetical protein
MDSQPQFSDEELARAWIRRFSKNRKRVLSLDNPDKQLREDRRIETETNWASNELQKLVRDDPGRAWTMILLILKLAQQDEDALDNLAAGPLESFLVHHGPDVVERVEKEARLNPQLKDLLLGVWGNSVDATVWRRLQALLDNSTAC